MVGDLEQHRARDGQGRARGGEALVQGGDAQVRAGALAVLRQQALDLVPVAVARLEHDHWASGLELQRLQAVQEPREVVPNLGGARAGQEDEVSTGGVLWRRHLGQRLEDGVPHMGHAHLAPPEPLRLEGQDGQPKVHHAPVARCAPRGPGPVLRRDEVHRAHAAASGDARHGDMQRGRVDADEGVHGLGVEAGGEPLEEACVEAHPAGRLARVHGGPVHRVAQQLDSLGGEALASEAQQAGRRRAGQLEPQAQGADEAHGVGLAAGLGGRDQEGERAHLGHGRLAPGGRLCVAHAVQGLGA